MTYDVSWLKRVTDDSVVTHHANDRIIITGHFSNSAEMLKFRGKGQIPRLGSKFRSPRKTVGPTDIIGFVSYYYYWSLHIFSEVKVFVVDPLHLKSGVQCSGVMVWLMISGPVAQLISSIFTEICFINVKCLLIRQICCNTTLTVYEKLSEFSFKPKIKQ